MTVVNKQIIDCCHYFCWCEHIKTQICHANTSDLYAEKTWRDKLDFPDKLKEGRYQTLPLGSKSSILVWEVSILQLYIFIWNMKSKVLDSQQWWSSIIIINLCSCNGLLASEGPDRRVYASEFELLNKLWWWSYIVNVRHIWWTSVMYDRRHILWMSIINEYDGCPSCMTYGCQSYM